jgi:hypothetical protein
MAPQQLPPRQTGIIDAGAGRRQSTMPPARTNSGGRPAQEDQLLQLKKYDTVIIVRIPVKSEANFVVFCLCCSCLVLTVYGQVDDSSSMSGALWWEAKEALTQLAELASKYDEDGIDVHFLYVSDPVLAHPSDKHSTATQGRKELVLVLPRSSNCLRKWIRTVSILR